MIKTVIIDDERLIRLNFQSLLELECPQLEILGTADGVTTGLSLIKTVQPDLVFLDIQMRDGTGFDMLDQLELINFQIVFVTAYDDFAIKAFKYSAIDYLLKPIHPDELQGAVNRAIKNIQLNYFPENINSLLNNLREEKFEKIAIPTAQGFIFIEVDNIIQIESDGNYSIFHLDVGKKILVSKTLKDFEEMLNTDNFYRIHRSHLINLNYLKKHSNEEGGYLVMTNGDKIPISRRKKEAFISLLKSFFENNSSSS